MSKIKKVIIGMKKGNVPSNYWVSPKIELPELNDSQFVFQRNGQSVWKHTMSVIDLLTIKNDITLLSGLFHDLGKGCTPPMDDISLPRFPGHAEESAKIVERILPEWGANPYLINRVSRLVSTHMFDISNAMRDKTIRKFIADVGFDNVDNWFVVRIADSRSYATHQQYRNRFIEPFRKAVTLFLEQQPSLGQPDFEATEESGVIWIKGGK